MWRRAQRYRGSTFRPSPPPFCIRRPEPSPKVRRASPPPPSRISKTALSPPKLSSQSNPRRVQSLSQSWRCSKSDFFARRWRRRNRQKRAVREGGSARSIPRGGFWCGPGIDEWNGGEIGADFRSSSPEPRCRETWQAQYHE